MSENETEMTTAGAELPTVDASQGASILGVADLLKDIGAACTGYRRQLIEGGWSEPVAEQVAAAALLSWQHRVLGSCR